jgi:HSP20 family protein
MSTLDQFRNSLSRTWESLTEGWHKLRDRAEHAMTRFHPLAKQGQLDTWEDQVIRHSSDWGLLAAEVKEDEDEVTVRLEVPGMDKDNFSIDVIDDYLVVRGEKRVESDRTEGRFHVMECAYGSFERAVPLPVAVDGNAAKASYRRGVLSVSLPKHQRARRRRIPVSSG